MSHLADTPVCRSYPRLKRIPDPLLRYAAALLLLALLTGLAFLTRFAFGFGASVLYGLFYFIAILGAAWLGYGQGLVVCTLLTYVVAPWFSTRPVRFRPLDLGRFAVLLAFSFVVSTISFLVRRRQEELMRSTEELENRVRQGTEEARRNADARREIERSVREQAQLLDLAHDAIFSLDFDGTIRFWNSGAEQMYGWSRHEAAGRCSHDLLQTVFPAPLEQIEEKLRVSGRWQGELIHTHRDGTHLRVLSRWALRTGPDGQPAGYLEINTDITEKRRIEEQLRHTQKLESLGVLAGGVAHDFNNLLTGILGNASLALDSMPSHHPNRMLLEEVMKAAERAADLTRQLLAYAGKGRFVMRTVDLSAAGSRNQRPGADLDPENRPPPAATGRTAAGNRRRPRATPADRHEPGDQRRGGDRSGRRHRVDPHQHPARGRALHRDHVQRRRTAFVPATTFRWRCTTRAAA